MADDQKTRRDFLYVATGAVATGGLATAAWLMIAHMGPAGDVREPVFDVDVSDLAQGQQIKLVWMGKPVFIRHRTPEEIESAKDVDLTTLGHPETDRERLRKLPDGKYNEDYLVLYGVCPHFGCVPVGDAGDFDGWYCPCHGAHFDTSGRTRKGPPATNMAIPPYKWLSKTRLSLITEAQYQREKTLKPMKLQ